MMRISRRQIVPSYVQGLFWFGVFVAMIWAGRQILNGNAERFVKKQFDYPLQRELIRDSTTNAIWGIRFTSFKHNDEEVIAMDELGNYYTRRTREDLYSFYQGQSVEPGKRINLVYFAEPLDPKFLPNHPYAFLELKDQTMPKGGKVEVVPVNAADPASGYKLVRRR